MELTEEGLNTKQGCPALPNPGQLGGLGTQLYPGADSFQPETFLPPEHSPFKPMPKGAAVISPASKEVRLYTRSKEVSPHETHKILLASVPHY